MRKIKIKSLMNIHDRKQIQGKTFIKLISIEFSAINLKNKSTRCK